MGRTCLFRLSCIRSRWLTGIVSGLLTLATSQGRSGTAGWWCSAKARRRVSTSTAGRGPMRRCRSTWWRTNWRTPCSIAPRTRLQARVGRSRRRVCRHLASAVAFASAHPATEPAARYLIGDEAASAGGMRSLSDPAHARLTRITTAASAAGGDVHVNSTVASHAFYLAVEGGTEPDVGAHRRWRGRCEPRSGREGVHAGHSCTCCPPRRLSSTAREATMQSARDLYGPESAAARAIEQAWAAVGCEVDWGRMPRSAVARAMRRCRPARRARHAVAALGQQPASVRPLPRAAPGLSFDMVVVDRDGRVPDSLSPADITVSVDGKPRRVAGRAACQPRTGGHDRRHRPARPAQPASPPSRPSRSGTCSWLSIRPASCAARNVPPSASGRALLDRLGMADRLAVVLLPLPRDQMLSLATEQPVAREMLAEVGRADRPGRAREADATAFAAAGNPMLSDPDRLREAEPVPVAAPAPVMRDPTRHRRRARSTNSPSLLDAIRTVPGRKVSRSSRRDSTNHAPAQVSAVAAAAVAARAAIHVFAVPGPRDDAGIEPAGGVARNARALDRRRVRVARTEPGARPRPHRVRTGARATSWSSNRPYGCRRQAAHAPRRGGRAGA